MDANQARREEVERPEEELVNKAEPADDPSTAAPVDELAALASERDRLAQEKAALYDQLLRKQAEFENFRKRVEREKKEFRVTASMEAVKAMLPILDGLERALSTPTPEPGLERPGAPAAVWPEAAGASEFRKGIELLHRKMLETLEKMGLEPIETRGQKFDPHIHHAVEMVESAEYEDQSILEECQRGYRFHNRLLRPAMVRVSVHPKE